MAQVEKHNTFTHKHHNINLLWASLFIEELIRHGISDFCIAPGSRSTPLTLAAAKHPNAKTHVHFDERGLGFLALGLSQASAKPVVVIVTSGTAVANLYPAVIEAKQSHIPLIIISADRPPELIDCTANQAIEQHKIFADYPVFFCQIPSPTTSIKSNFLLTTIDQGLFQQGMTLGPIHFNMAFTEPFYPQNETIDFSAYLSSLKGWETHQSPFTVYHHANSPAQHNSLSSHVFPESQKIDLNAQRILVVVGRIKDKKQALAIERFCIQSNLVLFSDVQSQLQGSPHNINGYDLLLENENFKQLVQQTDLILQFSDHLISKRLSQLISSSTATIWEISEHKQRLDPSHCVGQRFVTYPSCFIQQVSNSKSIDNTWFNKVNRYKTTLTTITNEYVTDDKISEINCTAYMLNQSTDNIVLANSMAIRLADMFAQTEAHIYSNRGASGIDGLIATAVGIAKNNGSPTSLLIGDTSFLYDLNSLTLLQQLQQPFVIVLLNNDGGGIFNLLPVPESEKQVFYQLPHALTFKNTCDQFSIRYQQPTTFSEFKTHYQDALITEDNKTTLIEVCVSNQLTATQLQAIKEQLQHAII